MKNIAIKFCGGCNPTYDRLHFWKDVQSKTEGKVNWVMADQAGYEAVLVICGCHTACPAKFFTPDDYKLFMVVTDDATSSGTVAEKIIAWGET